jgi:transcriptional regulator with XRE-family HTH domain
MKLDFQTAFGEIVREKRLAKGFTLRHLSGNGYLALGYLSEVERGQKCPSSEIIEAIANGLGEQAHDLIIETGVRMASDQIPQTAESLFPLIRNADWQKQYADLR